MYRVTRREILSGFLQSLPVVPGAVSAAAAIPKRPNIILILLDDLGYGQFGPNRDMFDLNQINPILLERDKGKVRPEAAAAAARNAVDHIARLSIEGTRFTDAYVACPLCAPSRAAILTSRYPQRFGGYVNRDITRYGVPTSWLFLPQALQRSGYSTAAIGKWHVAKIPEGMNAGTGQHPLDRGFDYFFGFNHHSSDYYDSNILWRNRTKAAARGYLTEQFTDEAIGFIRRSKDRPFFAYLAYNAVHGPLEKPAPDRYLRKFHTGNRSVDNFYAYLNAADEGVGRILQALREEGKYDNTLIFLLSDNGASGGSPMPSNAPFLGFKGQVWQGGVRIPLVIWGSGNTLARKVCGEPVMSTDLLPTALDAAGASLPAGHQVDGRSLLPLLHGEQKGAVHDYLFWAGQFAHQWAGSPDEDELRAPAAWAVRKGRWMLRYWSHLRRYELYDLETDRGERHDVISREPGVVRELKAAYSRWFPGLKKPVMWSEAAWKGLIPAD